MELAKFSTGVKDFMLFGIALLTAWNTYKVGTIKNELDIESQRLDIELKEKDFRNNLRVKMYDEVKVAISKKDSSTQKVVNILIESILSEDTLYLEKLRLIMKQSENVGPDIKTSIINNQTFQSEQQTIPKIVTEKKSELSKRYLVDVFYLEGENDSLMKTARRIVDELRTKFSERFSVRLRILPKAVNARSGYNIQFNEIRFEKLEKNEAMNVLNFVNSPNVNVKQEFVAHEIFYDTPNYFSVFVVNN